MLIRTVETQKPIQLKIGMKVGLCSDKSLINQHDKIVAVDCEDIHRYLKTGDKITINYGQIELKVTGFLPKSSLL
jgi:pyruvate kinase